MMMTIQILPARGEGDHAQHGGGGSRPYAKLLMEGTPLRQPLRGCHLPMNGEDCA